MENETNTVDELGKVQLPAPLQSWTIEFHKELPFEEISREQLLIEEFMDAHLTEFLSMKSNQVKRLFKYRWTPLLKRKSHRYKLEVFAADFTFAICKDDNKYIVFKPDPIFKGSDKNTVKLKPPAV
jgi:hypothetical protein